jgi:uncharacterized protein YbjT (DUF2867 family)
MILVVGATGILGSEICRRLRARGLPVRALVRQGSAKEAALRQQGIDIAHGDLRSPASLAKACEGVVAVISTATAMGAKDKSLTLRAVDREGQLALVAAAKASGVEQFIYISLSPNLQPTAPLVRYKREVEHAVRTSGMRWTILQPSCFMEVWLGEPLGWDVLKGRASIFGDGTKPLSWISAGDVAEYAVRSVTDPRLANRDVPLGGPEALPPNDVVKVFEQLSGRSYSIKRVPRPVLTLLGPIVARLNEGAGSGMSLGAQTATRGDVVQSELQREIAVPLTTVREYAKRVLP